MGHNQPNNNNNKSLQWTGQMEKAAMKLYTEATLQGKQSDGIFKADVHFYVVQKLNEEFPGSNFTEKKCKSKLSQGCLYFFFWLCCYLFYDIVLILYPICFSDIQKGKNFLLVPMQVVLDETRSAASLIHTQGILGVSHFQIGLTCSFYSGHIKAVKSHLRMTLQVTQEEWSRGCKHQCESSGMILSNTIDKLIGAFAPDQMSQRVESALSSFNESAGTQGGSSWNQRADTDIVNDVVSFYQDTMAASLPMEELLAGLSVLKNPSKSHLHLHMDDKYKNNWLLFEIRQSLSKSLGRDA
ncbi:hypothetical protein VP01_3189g2 [Puccinia sorghi]|uniref:Myb/SANT-like domain-containing protein n=1 Tax=Puccinia sorghi TaxID=27349 RepID=A0A0L6UYQ3_9BASI|nr:hypothetical protein VP01_3189g2 [Puccinia sorghi]